MAARRVVVTGLGVVTPLGVGLKHAWPALLASKSGIRHLAGAEWDGLPVRIAGTIPEGPRAEGGWRASDWLEPGEERRIARFAQYALAAATEALDDAGWRPEREEDLRDTGVYIGSGIGALDEVVSTALAFSTGGYKKVSPHFVPRLLINLAAGHVSMKFGFRGPTHATATACTTGAHSIGDAARLIAHGDCNVVLAGGTESCIHPLAIAGFARARSLVTSFQTPESASRPFDRDRSGFVIAEGAGVMLLEELEHAKARGARIYAELRGYGLSSDAWHVTQPRADGEGPRRAMENALRFAGCRPREVDYVSAHATGTVLGDRAENGAVKEVLLGEEGWARAVEVNVGSVKGALGHLLGAAGAVEGVFAVKSVAEDVIPLTLNLDNPGDPPSEFNCNYIPHSAQHRRVDVALSNSFGFGGTNACLCFSKFKG
ncbi:ketoacyl synthase domain-containing protein [Trichodelitschia bisporula]|uniref:3-oxoacyl-[acyl-carrier-protein] synthase n=1 Tax=Trichodelitschia bisporula TaxID=703511 RepID=A0A6G1HXD4_9PEZI|nr:ketoacyl synthase domain-containing protein [Trichodelitschia bisporula]